MPRLYVLSYNRFYPYILMVSCLFLLATLIIYTIWSKFLLNHYTRIVRHFTFSMMVAFIVLVINQMYSFSENYPTLCIFFGIVTTNWISFMMN
jgi:hypothetical protein